MDDKDIPKSSPSDWQPMTNKCDLAVLGKLGEEICEAGAKVFRSIIQGIMSADPETGKINLHAVEDELADIEAMVNHAIFRFGLNASRMHERVNAKFNYKAPWFEALAREDDRANRA